MAPWSWLRFRKILILGGGVLSAIIPASYPRQVLHELTSFLIDGGNQFMRDLIFLAAPLVLP